MKFAPQTAGKSTFGLFTKVKDKLLNDIQNKFEHGYEVAEALRPGVPHNHNASKPTRTILTAKEEKEEPLRKLKQDGLDIEHQNEHSEWLKKKGEIDTGMMKAYTYIIQYYCDDSMIKKLEKHTPYIDGTIRNKPIELLKEIETLTHATIRNEYPYVSSITHLLNLIYCRQYDEESLTDFSS